MIAQRLPVPGGEVDEPHLDVVDRRDPVPQLAPLGLLERVVGGQGVVDFEARRPRVERELRKFFRSPALMLVSMVFPLVQLIVLGNAFGGKIKEARLGVVDQDNGTQSVKVREALVAVQSNADSRASISEANRPSSRGPTEPEVSMARTTSPSSSERSPGR